MNSAYGFYGASRGFLPCVPIAASVTASGRLMLEKTKNLAETLIPGSKVVYGDSVAGYTPIIVRRSGEVLVVRIEDLASTWTVSEGGKESAELDDLYTWSDIGWTRIERVIRHELAPGKGMVRVLTHTGLVDATMDHSLLRPDGSSVSPCELAIGDELLHADLPDLFGSRGVSPAEARVMGATFMGDTTTCIPSIILNSDSETRESFWRGLCEANGHKDEIDTKSQVSAASIALLAASLGYSASLDTLLDIFRVTCTTNKIRSNAIEKIHPIEYSGYVYDLTTTNNHFAAGPGRLVVHNTASCLCLFCMLCRAVCLTALPACRIAA